MGVERRCCVSWSLVVLGSTTRHGIAGPPFLTMPASSTELCVTGPGFRNNDFERHLAAAVRQGSEVEGEDDADQFRAPLRANGYLFSEFTARLPLQQASLHYPN